MFKVRGYHGLLVVLLKMKFGHAIDDIFRNGMGVVLKFSVRRILYLGLTIITIKDFIHCYLYMLF